MRCTLSRIVVGGLLALWVTTVAGTAVAGAERQAQPATRSGKKKLLLFAKDPVTWQIVKGGGSGQMVYREATGSFTLSAAGLQPRAGYTLVRVEDAPAAGQVVAKGVTNAKGQLELDGVWHAWSKKFWLIASEDVTGAVGSTASLRAWRPARYLFEEKPLGVPCDCPEPEEP
jgi:hypothetical protein